MEKFKFWCCLLIASDFIFHIFAATSDENINISTKHTDHRTVRSTQINDASQSYPCLLPSDLPDKLQIYSASEPYAEIPKGYYASIGAVNYLCKDEFKLVGNSTNFCLAENWIISDHPTCTECTKDRIDYCKSTNLATSDRSDCLRLLDQCSGSDEVELPQPAEEQCLVPDSLSDEIRVYYGAKRYQEIRKGSYVAPGAIIYKCITEHRLEGSTTNFCTDGKWIVNHPKCTECSKFKKRIEYCKNTPFHELTKDGPGCSRLLDQCPGLYIISNRDTGSDVDTSFSSGEISSSILEKPSIVEGSCLVPSSLSNEIRVYYGAKPDQEIPKGTYIGPYLDIIYKCKGMYTLYGSNKNFCLNGKWSILNHPKCIKVCSPLTGISIAATCEIDGETVSCNQPLRPNTTAHITCAVGYRKPADNFVDILRCDDDGEWDFQEIRCEQICGLEAPEAVKYIIGGEFSNITKVPWHVGIYSNINHHRTFMQICGGTIINAKVVISAAHCFWDSTEDKFHDASHFKVGVGKYFRDFDAIEPLKPQILNVAQINHEPKYNDYAGLYTFDIVLLVLVDYIKFQHYIKPICLETLYYNDKNIAPGLIGRVAGWGLETSGGKSSTELKSIELPAIEYNECMQVFSSDFRPFITGDKFCAGLSDGQSVCQGDSGGGLVFPKIIGENIVYFLRGIVSIGSSKGGSCDNDKYSLFTNIQYHIEMINFHESHNRPK